MDNTFNKFFVNVGPNIDKSIPRTRKAPLGYLKNANPSSLFLAPVTSDKIEIIIKSLNTKKIDWSLQHTCISSEDPQQAYC